MPSTDHPARLTRRRLLLLLGGSAAGAGLLAVSGTASAETPARDQQALIGAAVAAVLAPPALAATTSAAAQSGTPLAGFQQATQSSFNPINSTLAFGVPTDVAAGWDGTLWAIDAIGAPHVYDPISDSWQLHGTGIDGAALINDQGPRVYFRGSEMFIDNGQSTGLNTSIATIWPQLPPSYRKFGVKGAAWAAGKLVLFRGGTYLTVPWNNGAPAPAEPVATATATPAAAPATTEAAGTQTAGTQTPAPATVTPTAALATPAAATQTPAAATRTPGIVGAASIYHDALLAADTVTPTAAPTRTAAPTASAAATRTPTPMAKPSDSPTPAASPSAAVTGTPDATPTSAAATATASSTPAASPTGTPVATDTPTPGVTPTPEASPSPTGEPSVTPTASPTPAAVPAAPLDYVASPLKGITGWPQTGSWSLGVIDGVYSQGNNVVLVISGGEFMTLTFTDSAAPTATGLTQLSQHASFASLPSEWLMNGFDAGYFLPSLNAIFIFNGPQFMVSGVNVGAEERPVSPAPEASPTATASPTPSPSAEVVPTATPRATTITTLTPEATRAPEQTPATPLAAAPIYHAALLAAETATPGAPSPTRTVDTTPTAAAGTPTPTAVRTAASTPTPGTTPIITPTPGTTQTSAPTPGGTQTSTPTPGTTQTSTPTPGATPQGTPSPEPTVDLMGASNADTHYIAVVANGWPVTWHPKLQHAPSGRTSGLWCATFDGRIVNFDGTSWTQQPGDAISVAAGKDGSVFAVGMANQQQLSQWNGTAFTPVAQHTSNLSQVSVGGQNQVWTRDSNNTVNQLSQGQLQSVALAGSAAHIAANYDGTLWSCTGNDAQALRLAPDLQQPPAAIAAAGTVQKVASTGFGAAHCLVGQGGSGQLYRYDSPYVFRTPGPYNFTTGQAIEQGLGSLFFLAQSHEDETGQPAPTYQVVALDAHTGVELSRSAVAPPNVRYTAPAFDAVHETIIVGLTTNPYASGPQPGQLLGLDARDLSTVRWSITLPNNLSLGPGRPTLQATQLCVSDNLSSVVMYDTGSSPTTTTPTYQWTYSFPAQSGLVNILPPPVLANGNVYAIWWIFAPGDGYLEIYLASLEASTGTGSQNALQTGPGGYYYDNDPRTSPVWASVSPSMAQFPPVLGTVPVPGSPAGQTRQMLFVNGGTRVWGTDVNTLTANAYVLQGSTFAGTNGSPEATGSKIVSGLSFGQFADVNSNIGVVWFGDDGGNLHAVNSQDMTALPNMPTAPGPLGTGIATTPVLYTDAQGEAAVLLSNTGAEPPALLVFDPISHNVVSVPTPGTNLGALSTMVTNGILYAGGSEVNYGSATAPSAQVFGIRVDQAVQELRDFIVDSQLMQDFDQPPAGEEMTYAGVARYQTHLTLVDDAKAPLINEPVKLWADQANTIVLVNDQSYTLGPDDDQFASMKTSSSGQLVIVSGSLQTDGSDKTNMNAVPLRAWASFMNPYERMLVMPDQEFHNRVATAHSTDPGQAGADDPTRANLQTAETYGGGVDLKSQGNGTSNQLFTAPQKKDNQPQQVASAIQTMTGSVGTGPPSGSKTLKASFTLHATDTAGSYIAYTNTPGAQYSPVNVATNRAALVLNTTGFSYSLNDTGTPTFSMSNPAAATMAIDALQGTDWSTSQYAQPAVQTAASVQLGGAALLGADPPTNFWDWLAGQIASAAVTVTDIIVSVAEDIYAGIRLLVKGVEYVFTTIINGIEQAVNAIGAFFVELGHLIEEVLEALSILFQFGHIIDTHNILKAELLKRINGDGSAAYPGLVALVGSPSMGSTAATGAIAHVDAFFQQGEQTITDKFNSLANALSGTSSSSLAGGGSTVHSAFTATPKGGGASSSNSTQATWGLQKFQGGVGGGGGASVAMALASAGRLQGADDPSTVIGTIFTDFAARLTSDAQLSSQWAQVQSGAQQMNNTSSGADFVKDGLAELLRILALIIDGVLAVTNAFVDAILGGIAALVEVMFDPSTGLLTAPLDIPVLSWLYQLLFGEPLTILNAVLLVIAIPVTILWRIIEGEWPSDSVNAVAARPAALGQGLAPAAIQKMLGVTSALFSLVLGFMDGITDLIPNAPADTPLVYIVSRVELLLSVLGSLASAPIWTEATPASEDWAAWAVSLGSGLLDILSAIPSLSAATDSTLSSSLEAALSLMQAIIMGAQFKDNPPPNGIGDAAFGLNIAALLPGFINPVKLNSEIGAIVVAACDVIFGVVGCVAGFLSTFNPANT